MLVEDLHGLKRLEKNILWEKDQIRSMLLAVRKSLDSGFIHRASNDIGHRISSAVAQRPFKTFALYFPLSGEVNTEPLFKSLQESHQNHSALIYVPRIVPRGGGHHDMELCPISSWMDREKSPLGGWQSKASYGEVSGSCRPEDIDCWIVPGVAFDVKGYRIGFGGGYYDRILKDAVGLKIGVGYEWQVLSDLPHEGHDIPCDWVVTENRIIHSKKHC